MFTVSLLDAAPMTRAAAIEIGRQWLGTYDATGLQSSVYVVYRDVEREIRWVCL